MTNSQEIILRAISSFCNEENLADFTYTNLNDVCKYDSTKRILKELVNLDLVENRTKNGYANRIYVKNPLPCPSFIFNKDLRLIDKGYALECMKSVEKYGEVKNPIYKNQVFLDSRGYTEDYFKNIVYIKNKISVSGDVELKHDDFGYRIINKQIKPEYKCKYCGETDPLKFSNSSRTLCKECLKKQQRSLIPLEEKLYTRAKHSAMSRKLDFDLTILDVKNILEGQNNKCKYSGIKFGDNFNDKYTYPTIDRIDSSKGYIKDNICICTFFVNMMKNNCPVNKFKSIITDIYNNINNF